MDFSSDSSEKNNQIKTAVLKERKLSRFAALERLLEAFSPLERLLLYVFTVLLGLCTFALLAGANAAISVTVPAAGGELVEGLVGPARFINPVLSSSQADEDLTSLIYSGLTRALPDGTIIPDLASNYEISEDGTTYTFTLRDGLTFHDGEALTSEDVLFTVQAIQNPEMKSTHRADWEGVSVSAPDAKTIVFKLPHAYAPFLQNTTLGIMPRHLWTNVTPEEFPFAPANTHPIGSGPYQVEDFTTTSTGSPTRYTLIPFKKFALGEPFLSKITFLFYPNEKEMVEALNAGRIDAVAGMSPSQLSNLGRTDISVMTSVLPRVFGVFYNQNRSPVLANSSVRAALDAALDKQRLVDSVLSGYGVPLHSPVPPGLIEAAPVHAEPQATSSLAYTDASIEAARAILTKGGWTYSAESNTWTNKQKQALQFTLATADSPQLVATANAVAAAWKTLGVSVTVQTYTLSDLNVSVIRPRQYDALLFGEVVGRELDLFAFWHSSQRNDPGLNVSLYTNSRADNLLSQARATTNPADRAALYRQFAEVVAADRPATFLYAPEFVYVVPKSMQGVELGALTTAAERFFSVYEWYTDTEHVWSFFAPESDLH